jgi:hypothetical protein
LLHLASCRIKQTKRIKEGFMRGRNKTPISSCIFV